jgi:small-conductance mechanosensitive channel
MPDVDPPRFAALRCVRALLVAAALAAGTCVGAAESPSIDTGTQVRQSASVIIANRKVIVLRGPIAGYSAQERASNVTQRIEDALNSGAPTPITFEETESGTQVLLGSKLAFQVTGIDIDREAVETTRIVAREAAKRLEQAITEYRDQHTPRYLLIQSAWTLLATVLLAIVLRALYIADRWVGRRLAGAAAARAEKVHVHGVSLLDPQQIRWLARRAVWLVVWTLTLFAAYTWLTYTLKQFPYTRGWGEHMEGNFLDLVGKVILGILGGLPGLAVAGVIMLIAYFMVRLAQLLFDRVASGSLTLGGLDADTVVPTRRIYQMIVWAFALALAYPYLPGAETEAFKGLSVLVGVMVSIGASSVVGQAASGLILMYTRAFRAGEYVRIGDTEGTIVGLGTFATRVRTGLGEEVLLPNSYALQNTTRNFSRVVGGKGFVVNTPVTIGYSTPWRQVHSMLEEAARRTRDIAAVPAPYVRQTALSDFYVEYRLIATSVVATPVGRVDMLSELHANIQDVFNEYGVQIMSPHYMTDPAQAQVVPKDQWYAAPAKPPAG